MTAPNPTPSQRLAHALQHHTARFLVLGGNQYGINISKSLQSTGYHTLIVESDPTSLSATHASLTADPKAPRGLYAAPRHPNPQEVTVIVVAIATVGDDNPTRAANLMDLLTPFLNPGQLIILERPTWPNVTESDLLPLLTEQGFKEGEDIFLCHSPEWHDLGPKTWRPVQQLANIPYERMRGVKKGTTKPSNPIPIQ